MKKNILLLQQCLMEIKKNASKIILIFVFICYVVVLFLFVVMKVNYEALAITRECIKMNRASGFWNINLIPFKTLRGYLDSNNSLDFDNFFGNIIPFLPMGFLLGFIFNKSRRRFIKSILVSFLIILTFELIQFFACIGYLDIDDIILNVLSSSLGYLPCLIIIDKINLIQNEMKAQ